MRNTFLSMTMCVLTLSVFANAARAQDAAAATKTKLGDNAALIYWQAFDQLAAVMDDEANRALINEWQTVALDEKVKTLVEQSVALGLLHLAAAIDDCDWGIERVLHQDGPGTLLPHMSKARELMRLTLLRARYRLANGQTDGAVADIVASYRLARHAAADALLISMLVGIAIESGTHALVAEHFDRFDDAALKKLREGLSKLPVKPTLRQTLRSERTGFLDWTQRTLTRLNEDDAKRAMAALGIAAFAGRETLLEMLEDAQKEYDKLDKMLDLPPAEFRPKYDAWIKGVEDSGNTLMKLLVPAYDAAFAAHHASLAQDAIMNAAITRRLDGEEAFKAIKDPYGDGPFTLKESDKGIEIRSVFKRRDEAVALTFSEKSN